MAPAPNPHPLFQQLNHIYDEKKEVEKVPCKELNGEAVAGLIQLEKVMVAGNYANRSIVAYVREIRFFAEYFPDLKPVEWSENHVVEYMNYLKITLGASYSKHKMVAQSMVFFF